MSEDNQNKETVIQEFHERVPGYWARLVIYVLLAFIVAFIVVFGGRAVYRHYHHTSAIKTVPANTKELPPEPSASNSSGSGKGSTKSDNTGKSGQTASNGSLPNSGPGDVVGLFVGASVVAGGLHFVVNSQRSVKNS